LWDIDINYLCFRRRARCRRTRFRPRHRTRVLMIVLPSTSSIR
jgi:hypothetical protein